MELFTANRVHILGIGGIGVSAIAKILHAGGVRVTGSDAAASLITDELSLRGISVVIGHIAENLPSDVDAVVYSGAVPADNVERVAATDREVPQFSYSEALGALSRTRRTIAISGTHGKSTTTSMLGSILIHAGLDPLIIVGTRVAAFSDGNVHLGRGDFCVVEACEHEAQMMRLVPERIIVTNLEPDHLDYYGSFENLIETFKKYVARVPADHCVANADDKAVMSLFGNDGAAGPRTIGAKAGMLRCVSRRTDTGVQRVQIEDAETGSQFELALRIPGAFNVLNALCALEMARSIGIGLELAIEALEQFPGSWRRFERVGTFHDAPVISDYGHHPTAVRETIRAAREFFPGRRIFLVYQPHQHHRTEALYKDFVDALQESDALVLCEIYDVVGREHGSSAASAHGIIDELSARDADKPLWYAQSLSDAVEYVRSNVEPNDILLVMGAGDIYKIADMLCSK